MLVRKRLAHDSAVVVQRPAMLYLAVVAAALLLATRPSPRRASPRKRPAHGGSRLSLPPNRAGVNNQSINNQFGGAALIKY
jgi:hypothetical protein